jgi:N-acetylmuramoyl-L-alanine amidase
MIYLDIQHIGKPNKRKDMGASIGDKPEQTEAYWTSLYAFFCEMKLRELGHEVMRITDGIYSSRHSRVNNYHSYREDQGVYISCHINAGGGDKGIMFYDYRSLRGKELAKCICTKLSELTQISTTKSIACRPEDWTKNAFNTIKGIQRPVAICCEPFFIDNPRNQELLTFSNIKRVGELLAEGIHLWYNQN